MFIYLAAFVLISIYFIAKVWKKLPTDDKDASVYTREFWIFLLKILNFISIVKRNQNISFQIKVIVDFIRPEF